MRLLSANWMRVSVVGVWMVNLMRMLCCAVPKKKSTHPAREHAANWTLHPQLPNPAFPQV
jgi:hypothetical protein